MKKTPNTKHVLFKRNSILGFILFFLTLTITAQQGINYKAIIKDNAGDVVANDLIVVL